jgi:hypothetical protein
VISARGRRRALTRELAHSDRKGHILRRQACESNSFVCVLTPSYTSLLDPRGSIFPDLLIKRNSGLHAVGEVILIGKDDAECSSVLDGLTGPLGLMRLFPQNLRTRFRG